MLQILEERGFVNQIVGTRDELNTLMVRNRVGAYVGIDPTALSMHVGHIIPFMALFWMYLYGYPAVTLLGGATAGVGDPTGRSTARIQNSRHVRMNNTRNIANQIQKLWKNVAVLAKKHLTEIPNDIQRDAKVLNNDDWLSKISIMDVLGTIGSGLRLGPLLGRDTVKTRMESSDGMSFSEFCYPVLQAWDWFHMFRRNRIQLQIGGADQYGNILSGMDAIKYAGKTLSPSAGKELSPDFLPMGFTVPLLTTPSGEKFGKSAGNAVWLDEDQTSVFDLYGFFVSQPDADVERLLKFFTFLPLTTIAQTMEEHIQSPEKRMAQHKLAREFVELVHGAEDAEMAEKQHRFLFAHSSLKKADVFKSDPDVVLPSSMMIGSPYAIALKLVGLSKTNSEGARLIKNGGGYLLTSSSSEDAKEEISFVPILSLDTHLVSEHHLMSTDESSWPRMVMRSGKRKVCVIELVSDKEMRKRKLSFPKEERLDNAPASP
ncbi:tyrosine-tRNA ligase [Venturia nashicola]|nr:tyrosine-tRNA ligase [Venturia nashicola]